MALFLWFNRLFSQRFLPWSFFASCCPPSRPAPEINLGCKFQNNLIAFIWLRQKTGARIGNRRFGGCLPSLRCSRQCGQSLFRFVFPRLTKGRQVYFNNKTDNNIFDSSQISDILQCIRALPSRFKEDRVRNIFEEIAAMLWICHPCFVMLLLILWLRRSCRHREKEKARMGTKAAETSADWSASIMKSLPRKYALPLSRLNSVQVAFRFPESLPLLHVHRRAFAAFATSQWLYFL